MGDVVQLPVAHEVWLTKRKLAAHWGVSPRTIERMMAAGLPSVYRSGKRRFRLSSAEQWRRASSKAGEHEAA